MPPESPVTQLKIHRIDAISDCPRGANQHAKVRLAKSAEEPMTLIEIQKAAEALPEADRETLAKALTAKPDPLASLPADHPIRKQLDAQAAELATLQKAMAERHEADSIAKCEAEVSALGVASIGKGDAVILHKADKAGFGADLRVLLAKVAGPLKASESKLGKMSGSVGEEGGASDKIAKIAAEIAKTEGRDHATAYTLACQRNPQLFNAIQRGE